MAVGGAVAVVVCADSILIRVAVGTLGNGAEEKVLGSRAGWHAEGEGSGGIAVDAVGAAAGDARDGAGGSWARGRGCEADDSGKSEEERGVLHCDGCLEVVDEIERLELERQCILNKGLFSLI